MGVLWSEVVREAGCDAGEEEGVQIVHQKICTIEIDPHLRLHSAFFLVPVLLQVRVLLCPTRSLILSLYCNTAFYLCCDLDPYPYPYLYPYLCCDPYLYRRHCRNLFYRSHTDENRGDLSCRNHKDDDHGLLLPLPLVFFGVGVGGVGVADVVCRRRHHLDRPCSYDWYHLG